ncbi:hypothetical protein RBB78_03795 [Tunturiibacter empetritectus]|uniref:hypothetical protein n=1 Tax=Tunturiibacter empetritectus TaxID=3069691 RepID=UPI003D9B083E
MQQSAELGDGGRDLGAQAGEVCRCGLAGAAGIVGGVAAYLSQATAQMSIERLVSGIEPGKLLGNLGEADVRRGRRLLAKQKEDEADQIGGGEGKQGCERYSYFLLP